jgi:hypothetical protein
MDISHVLACTSALLSGPLLMSQVVLTVSSSSPNLSPNSTVTCRTDT